MMRIAIIGGTGLIGSALAKELTAEGNEVLILSRSQPHKLAGTSLVTTQWDGEDAAKLASLLNGLSAVVNLAGESIGKGRWTEKRKELLVSSRLVPGEALTAAFQQMAEPPGVLIQASAVGYYGTGEFAVDEDSPAGTDFLARLCEYWEDSTKPVESRTRRVVIRSGLVLDAKKGILPQMILPFRLFVGGRIGSGRQWISWIHLQDEVRAIRFLLENQKICGVVNLTSPEPVTNADFGIATAKALHRPYWFPIPSIAMKVALGEMSLLILEGQKVMPGRLQKEEFEFHFPTLEKALADLLKS